MKKIESIGFLLAVCIAAMLVVYSCGGGPGGGETSEGPPSGATEIGLGVLHAPSSTSLNGNGNWCAEGADDPGKRFLPLTSSFHLLPPLGAESGNKTDSDPTLTDYLIVSVCKVANGDTCTKIEEFNSQTDKRGLAYIKLEGYQYHVNWKISEDLVGRDFEIHFFLGDLALGVVTFTPRAPRSLPIKFCIDNNPLIRAYVLNLKGLTATQITEQLISEFTLSAIEIAWILKTVGYGVEDIYVVLRDVLGISDAFELEDIFESLCIPQEEYLALTAFETVKRFAPVLKFDRAHKGLPMSADVYFNAMLTPMPDDSKGTITWSAGWNGPPQGNYWDSKSGLFWAIESVCARDECNNGMSNNNFQTLIAGKVPTYYRVISDRDVLGQGRLRIEYSWFYGFQYPCNDGWGAVGDDGAHHGDWESITVTTSPDRSQIEAVTYAFHGDWYTRRAGNFEVYNGERPVVYVGKTAHGNYHSQDHSGWMVGTPSHCCEYADYRNPVSGSVWENIHDNLVSLSLNSESWMLADRIGSAYKYNGKEYKINQWSWGPHISHCEFDLFGCWDWDHVSACGTHPTVKPIDWTLKSCDEEGCSGYTFVCAYSANYDQGWPLNYSP